MDEQLRFFSPADVGIDRAGYFERCWPGAETIAGFQFVRLVSDRRRGARHLRCHEDGWDALSQHRDPRVPRRPHPSGGGLLRLGPALRRRNPWRADIRGVWAFGAASGGRRGDHRPRVAAWGGRSPSDPDTIGHRSAIVRARGIGERLIGSGRDNQLGRLTLTMNRRLRCRRQPQLPRSPSRSCRHQWPARPSASSRSRSDTPRGGRARRASWHGYDDDGHDHQRDADPRRVCRAVPARAADGDRRVAARGDDGADRLDLRRRVGSMRAAPKPQPRQGPSDGHPQRDQPARVLDGQRGGRGAPDAADRLPELAVRLQPAAARQRELEPDDVCR